MSRLAHSYQPTMDIIEARNVYENCGRDEAFEIFDAAKLDNATIAEALGQEVAHEYCHWIYCNLK